MENPARHYPGDVVVYCGPILREGYDEISTILEEKSGKSRNLCLVLVTRGGDPDAAYRIARAMRHHYTNVEILVPDICKSAGTLLCIGADKLIFGDRGELGPLDIQLSKPDEMFDSMSGLDIIQALNALESQVLTSFRGYLLDIRRGSQIRTKTAADISVKLTDSFISPIAAKIDPITLGEHQRAMRIAYDYGHRLHDMAGSLKDDALVNLVSGYSSHGFVIDRKEAGELFNHVEAPDDSTSEIYAWARSTICKLPNDAPLLVFDVNETFEQSNNDDSEDEEHGEKQLNDEQREENGSSANKKPESKSESNERPNAKTDQKRSRPKTEGKEGSG